MEWTDGKHPSENLFNILVAIRNEIAEQNEEIRNLTTAVKDLKTVTIKNADPFGG